MSKQSGKMALRTRWFFYGEDIQVGGKSDWVPLQQILEYWLKQWETGKYGFKVDSHGRRDLHVFSWTEHDVNENVIACNNLLTAIKSRIPNSENSTRLSPIEESLLESQNYNSFTTAFLTRAHLPSFKFIAPGITYLKNDLFKTLHVSNAAKR